MKRKFEIEFPDEYGDTWMDVSYLLRFITSSDCIEEKMSIKIRDITNYPFNPPIAKRIYLQGGHDF